MTSTSPVHTVSKRGRRYGAAGTVGLINTRITKDKVTGKFAWVAGVALSDTEHVDITVKNSPVTDNISENCHPVTLVPACKNGA